LCIGTVFGPQKITVHKNKIEKGPWEHMTRTGDHMTDKNHEQEASFQVN